MGEGPTPCESPLVRPGLATDELVRLEGLFQALADRYRLSIVDMLVQADGQPICVCEFQDALLLKQPTVSYHLRRLVDAGVIEREQRGRYSYYALHAGILDRIDDLVRPREAVAA